MRQKDYRRAMDSMTAPNSAVQRALTAVREADLTEKVVPIREAKRKIGLRWTAAVAAALVLAVALGAVFTFRDHRTRDKAAEPHGFVIRAGAAEVNPDYFVEIGKMESDGASWRTEWDETSEEYSFLEYSRLQATVAYTIDNLRCSGEGADYFTYTVNGGYFIMDGRSGDVLEAYSSPDADGEMLLELMSDAGSDRFVLTDEEYNAFIAFSYSDDTGKYRELMEGDQGYTDDGERYIAPRYSEVFYQMFRENSDDRYMLITAHYQDGTAVSKKLIFDLVEKKVHDEEHITNYFLTAKIEE